MADNTIVFLWSDHGEGLPRAKRWPYDAGIRIPMIVRWPGHLKPNSTCEDLVSLIDLGPTVLFLTGLDMPYHMQGQSFLGEHARPREYVFASRDRYDEAYDMMRAVRDRRFKYIRNYRPELPYLLWISFSHDHAVWQEMWRLHAEGKLEGPQMLLMQSSRPVEELYDCVEDPYEINNLAKDPAYRKELERLCKALDDWRDDVGDMGEMPESEMVARMWPGRVQPVTGTPIVVPIHERHPGKQPVTKEASLDGPVHVMLHCGTQGASIAYTTEEGEEPHWLLYCGPIRLQPGRTVLRTKAIRIGYKESEENRVVFQIKETV